MLVWLLCGVAPSRRLLCHRCLLACHSGLPRCRPPGSPCYYRCRGTLPPWHRPAGLARLPSSLALSRSTPLRCLPRTDVTMPCQPPDIAGPFPLWPVPGLLLYGAALLGTSSARRSSMAPSMFPPCFSPFPTPSPLLSHQPPHAQALGPHGSLPYSTSQGYAQHRPASLASAPRPGLPRAALPHRTAMRKTLSGVDSWSHPPLQPRLLLCLPPIAVHAGNRRCRRGAPPLAPGPPGVEGLPSPAAVPRPPPGAPWSLSLPYASPSSAIGRFLCPTSLCFKVAGGLKGK